MKKYLYNGITKAAAAIVFVVMAVFACVCGVITIYSYGMDFNENTPREFQESVLCTDLCQTYLNEDLQDYAYWLTGVYSGENADYYLDRHEKAFSHENSNLRFNIYDSLGDLKFSNCDGEKPEKAIIESWEFTAIDSVENPNEGYTIECYFDPSGTADDDFTSALRFHDFMYSMRQVCVPLMVVAAFLALAALIISMSAAGRNSRDDTVRKRMLDRVPFEIVVGVITLLVICICAIMAELSGTVQIYPTLFYSSCVALAVWSVLFLILMDTIAVRCKRSEFFKSTLIYIVCTPLCRGVKRLFGLVVQIFRGFPIILKLVIFLLAFGAVVMILFVIAAADNSFGAVLIGFVLLCVGALLLCALALQFNTVKVGGERIADGDFSYVIPSAGISHDISELAESLNGINGALSKAVEDRMKSEHMKAELITNVSHDIKTPLTSIINYVDLLKKEDIDNETVREYIEVIDRQSARLKKLIADLIEASKASTGNITVDAKPMHVMELLGQSVAEYAERLEQAGLSPVIAAADDDYVLADGKLLWRVFDNLLANICKYSQPNTRVYVDVSGSENYVEIVLKNISRDTLAVSADELMQRFVRGDSARSTEGSGLGLSIAESLVNIQGGVFEIVIDGDLFKARVKLARYVSGEAADKGNLKSIEVKQED